MKSTQRTFALAATVWLPALCLPMSFLAPAVQAQEGPAIVSSRMMDAIEAWSSPSLTYEDLAFDSHPELIEDYVPELEKHHGGRPLAGIFADVLPQTLARFREATGGDIDSAAELLAFALGENGDEYRTWQNGLRAEALDFNSFVEVEHPETAAELAAANVTPADRGIGLLDFVHALDDPDLFNEVLAALDTVDKNPCTCRTFVSFPEVPYPWTLQNDDHYLDNVGFDQKHTDFTAWGRGAARNIDYYRYTKRQLWSETKSQNGNSSSLRLRMVCVRANEQFCDGPCQGDVLVRVAYASRVYEQHDVGGIWSKEAQALTADYAKLTYSGPAPLGPVLFEKGVAVSGQYHSGWNAANIASTFYAIGQIALTVAADSNSLTLDNDLLNTAVQGIGGLVTHEGSPGNVERDMRVTWENSISLTPNQTHLFELGTSSEIYTRGYGGKSWTWGNVDSALYIIALGRNYQCAAGVVAPASRAHWLQVGNSNTVYNAPTLQNELNTFIQVELGVSPNPSLLTPTIGAYP